MKERNTCPCKGCEDRYSGCHAVCEAYITWAAEMRKRKEAVCGKAERERMLNEFSTDGYSRVAKWTGRKA